MQCPDFQSPSVPPRLTQLILYFRLLVSIEKMVKPKEKKKKKVKEDPTLVKRRTLTYGRMHIAGSPSSFQFKKARFGGELPTKAHEIVFSGTADDTNKFGCKVTDGAEKSFLVVKRGECTYLEKVEMAEKSGAAGLIVVNTDNKALFAMPAGYDMTPQESSELASIPAVLVPLNALDVLVHLEEQAPFARAALIPLECNDDGCYPVYKTDFKFLSDNDASGGKIWVTDSGGGEWGFDYVTSEFGSVLPESGGMVLVKSDGGKNWGCENVQEDDDDYDGKILLVERGGCSFFKKMLVLQELGAKLVVLADDAEGGNLVAIGAKTEEVGKLHIPVAMISKRDGKKMKDVVEGREEEMGEGGGGMVFASLTNDRAVAVLWGEIGNFLLHCAGEEKGEGGEEKEGRGKLETCNQDYDRMRRAAESSRNHDKMEALDRYLARKGREEGEGGRAGEL